MHLGGVSQFKTKGYQYEYLWSCFGYNANTEYSAFLRIRICPGMGYDNKRPIQIPIRHAATKNGSHEINCFGQQRKHDTVGPLALRTLQCRVCRRRLRLHRQRRGHDHPGYFRSSLTRTGRRDRNPGRGQRHSCVASSRFRCGWSGQSSGDRCARSFSACRSRALYIGRIYVESMRSQTTRVY